MTHSTVNIETENRGSQEAYIHQINITSLDAAGQENYSPNSELNVPEDNNLQVIPAGQDNESLRYAWNSSGDHLNVQFLSDGTDAPNNSASGEVRLLVVGGGT